MKKTWFQPAPPPIGRPRAVELTPDQARELRALIVAANKNQTSGSVSMAWREMLGRHKDLREAWRIEEKATKHQLPAAVIEQARIAQALVPAHRQGARGLQHQTYTPGRLRRHWNETRRLYAGERFSWDDGTINFGVVVPWPWGGCPCSDRFGVKLGRFQLLLCHDDATSYVPAWSYVIRDAQSYNSADVAGALVRVARDVCIPDRAVLEGGSWQSKRALAALAAMGTELVDAKGRPNVKLVENYFNRLWTRLAIELPTVQVGRFRAENKSTSDLYVKCRSGREDPRKHFPMVDHAANAMAAAVAWLNEDRIESRTYGKWTPSERWEMDMEAHPRPRLSSDLLWFAAPVCETRTVSKGLISATATGPLGLPHRFIFSAPELAFYSGKKLDLYFDPLGDWPIRGIVAEPGKTTALVQVECVNPIDAGGTPRDMAAALRRMLRREYRVITPEFKKAETEIRHLSGTIEISSDHAGSRTAQPAGSGEDAGRGIRDHEPTHKTGRHGRAIQPAAEPAPTAETRNRLSQSLSNRAAAAQAATANW